MRTIKDIRPASEVPRLKQHTGRARPDLYKAGHWHHRKEDGTIIDVEITTHDLRFNQRPARLVLVHDITERKRVERALRRAHIELETKIRERTATLEAEIRERKRTEAELRRAKEAAVAAYLAKSEFLANMSHELRTPLNSVLGYAQILMQKGTLLPMQRKALSIIEQSGEHLLGLINEILELAKIEAGTLELNPSKVSLPHLLQNVVDSMRACAQDKGLTFTSEWLSEIPHTIKADERRLRQILMNLIDNAIKFTSEGGVTLKVGYHGKPLRFLVEDTGAGIRPEYLEEIFGIFHQVRDAGSVEEGTGLGLAICQRLVNLMGGDLKVASIPGEGSRFWFDLELPVITDPGKEPNIGSRTIIGISGNKRKLLVVDDREDNRSLLRDMLVQLGFEVHEAQDGSTCLRRVATLRPDAILMDLRMPGLCGEEVIRRVRALTDVRETTIIGISASAFEHNRKQCIEAGADDFLPKPIRTDILLRLLGHYLGLELLFEGVKTPEPSQVECGTQPTVLPAKYWESMTELARRGDIKNLRERAQQLSQLDERYEPFANELRALAERFKIKQIRRLLETTRRGA